MLSKPFVHQSSGTALISTNDTAQQPQPTSGEDILTTAVCIRPLAREELDKENVIEVVDPHTLVFDPGHDSEDDKKKSDRRKTIKYNFEYIFDASHRPDFIYQQTTKKIIQSVLEGKNASVFAYGGKGEGGKAIMLGTPSCPGLMVYAMKDLMKAVELREQERLRGDSTGTASETASKKITETLPLSMCYLEIYNDIIYDLLPPDGGARPLSLREESGSFSVTGVTVYQPKTSVQLYELLSQGNTNRVDSRSSHTILQVTIRYKNQVSKLAMVDLAGFTHTKMGSLSTSAKKTNNSLLVLGTCLNYILNHKPMVPYRDSILTRLLKDGMTRGAFLAAVNPCLTNYDETNHTLKFTYRLKVASTTNALTPLRSVNAPRAEANTTLFQLIAQLRQENLDLQTKLADLRNRFRHKLQQLKQEKAAELHYGEETKRRASVTAERNFTFGNASGRDAPRLLQNKLAPSNPPTTTTTTTSVTTTTVTTMITAAMQSDGISGSTSSIPGGLNPSASSGSLVKQKPLTSTLSAQQLSQQIRGTANVVGPGGRQLTRGSSVPSRIQDKRDERGRIRPQQPPPTTPKNMTPSKSVASLRTQAVKAKLAASATTPAFMKRQLNKDGGARMRGVSMDRAIEKPKPKSIVTSRIRAQSVDRKVFNKTKDAAVKNSPKTMGTAAPSHTNASTPKSTSSVNSSSSGSSSSSVSNIGQEAKTPKNTLSSVVDELDEFEDGGEETKGDVAASRFMDDDPLEGSAELQNELFGDDENVPAGEVDALFPPKLLQQLNQQQLDELAHKVFLLRKNLVEINTQTDPVEFVNSVSTQTESPNDNTSSSPAFVSVSTQTDPIDDDLSLSEMKEEKETKESKENISKEGEEEGAGGSSERKYSTVEGPEPSTASIVVIEDNATQTDQLKAVSCKIKKMNTDENTLNVAISHNRCDSNATEMSEIVNNEAGGDNLSDMNFNRSGSTSPLMVETKKDTSVIFQDQEEWNELKSIMTKIKESKGIPMQSATISTLFDRAQLLFQQADKKRKLQSSNPSEIAVLSSTATSVSSLQSTLSFATSASVVSFSSDSTVSPSLSTVVANIKGSHRKGRGHRRTNTSIARSGILTKDVSVGTSSQSLAVNSNHTPNTVKSKLKRRGSFPPSDLDLTVLASKSPFIQTWISMPLHSSLFPSTAQTTAKSSSSTSVSSGQTPSSVSSIFSPASSANRVPISITFPALSALSALYCFNPIAFVQSSTAQASSAGGTSAQMGNTTQGASVQSTLHKRRKSIPSYMPSFMPAHPSVAVLSSLASLPYLGETSQSRRPSTGGIINGGTVGTAASNMGILSTDGNRSTSHSTIMSPSPRTISSSSVMGTGTCSNAATAFTFGNYSGSTAVFTSSTSMTPSNGTNLTVNTTPTACLDVAVTAAMNGAYGYGRRSTTDGPISFDDASFPSVPSSPFHAAQMGQSGGHSSYSSSISQTAPEGYLTSFVSSAPSFASSSGTVSNSASASLSSSVKLPVSFSSILTRRRSLPSFLPSTLPAAYSTSFAHSASSGTLSTTPSPVGFVSFLSVPPFSALYSLSALMMNTNTLSFSSHDGILVSPVPTRFSISSTVPSSHSSIHFDAPRTVDPKVSKKRHSTSGPSSLPPKVPPLAIPSSPSNISGLSSPNASPSRRASVPSKLHMNSPSAALLSPTQQTRSFVPPASTGVDVKAVAKNIGSHGFNGPNVPFSFLNHITYYRTRTQFAYEAQPSNKQFVQPQARRTSGSSSSATTSSSFSSAPTSTFVSPSSSSSPQTTTTATTATTATATTISPTARASRSRLRVPSHTRSAHSSSPPKDTPANTLHKLATPVSVTVSTQTAPLAVAESPSTKTARVATLRQIFLHNQKECEPAPHNVHRDRSIFNRTNNPSNNTINQSIFQESSRNQEEHSPVGF